MAAVEDGYDTTLDLFVDDLIELRRELLADLERLEKMLVAAGVEVDPAKPKAKAAPAKKAGKPRAKKQQVSNGTLIRVRDAVRKAKEPVTTKTVHEMVSDLSPATVSKALNALVEKGDVEQAGVVQGVRGRRPLYILAGAPLVDRSFPPRGPAEAMESNGDPGEEVKPDDRFIS